MMNFLVEKFNIFYLLWKWTVIKAICPLIKVIKSENIYYSLTQDFDFVSQKKQSLLQVSCNIYIIAIVEISDISIHNLFNFCRQTSMHYCKWASLLMLFLREILSMYEVHGALATFFFALAVQYVALYVRGTHRDISNLKGAP